MNALEETISKAKVRQDEIRRELDGRRRGGNDTESNDIRKQLQALRNEFQQVLVRRRPPAAMWRCRLSACAAPTHASTVGFPHVLCRTCSEPLGV